MFYLFRRLLRDDDWRISEIMRHKSESMATKPEEIITKLTEQDIAVKWERV